MRRLVRLAAGMAVPAVLAAGLVASPGYAEGTAGAHSAAASTSHHRYDARTVFRGVFFGHGPVAAALPYTRDAPSATRSSTLAENTVMDRIDATHPGLLASVRAGLTSGSLVRTRTAVTRGRKAIATAGTAPELGTLGINPMTVCIDFGIVTSDPVAIVSYFGIAQSPRTASADLAAYQIVPALS